MNNGVWDRNGKARISS